ncbi:hypothetical protein RE6C_04279 [Rhodopirellula europaea 6C]|uniref:Uncharacterized protein n=1 Tax=Rhodopirellula europaea 6C TaxID=1263867 RepID=M2AQF0_9BACT|nr:hypothetical protein RE6C_04279 [Rhodopirellula europaea 6C]
MPDAHGIAALSRVTVRTGPLRTILAFDSIGRPCFATVDNACEALTHQDLPLPYRALFQQSSTTDAT